MKREQYLYEATVERVVDGDTIDVTIDLGFKIYKKERIRLYGINTPETYGVPKNSEEYRKGLQAKQFVKDMITPVTSGERIIIQTMKDKQGKYGRYLANVYYKTEYRPNRKSAWTCLNQELVDKGLAEVKNY